MLLRELTRHVSLFFVLGLDRYNYEPQGDDELKLMENDIITVLNKQDDGWWEGTIGTRRGVFPANYVAPV